MREEPYVSREAIKNLAKDVELLAEYASKHKIAIDRLNEIKTLVFNYKERKDIPGDRVDSTEDREGSTEDRDRLIEFHGILSSSLGEVNVDSLRATSGRFSSPAGRYLILLWLFTLVGMGLIGRYYYLDYEVDSLGLIPGEELSTEVENLLNRQSWANFFLPFTYGWLGACAYLMRLTGKRLKDCTFDPQHIPGHMNRLALGVLSGGIIILFVDDPDKIPVSQAAIGFLAGYSIDFFFQVLERIINAIMPKVGLDSISRKMDRNKVDLLINRYTQKLAQSTNDDEKKILEALIKDLRT